MKIGEVTTEKPIDVGRSTKYRAVYEAIRHLKVGEWMSVEFDNKNEARNITMCIHLYSGFRNNGIFFETHIKGTTVWVGRVEKNGSKP